MISQFNIINTKLSGLAILERKKIGDSRGYLERMFCNNELHELLEGKNILQINHTLTKKKASVRGMHFQYPPYAEKKFISCIKGEVYDVVVDLRVDSTTYLSWHAEVLHENSFKTIVIPEGFAHGFQTMTDDCEMLYFHTEVYNQDAEGGLNPKDPLLAITWPYNFSEQSIRDKNHPMIDQRFNGVKI